MKFKLSWRFTIIAFRKSGIVMALCLICCSILFSQIDAGIPSLRIYGTQYRLKELQKESPGIAATLSSNERYTSLFQQVGLIDTPTVALVFHIMSLPSGSTPLTVDDINFQIDRLHKDFLAPEHPYLNISYQHPELTYNANGELSGTKADVQTYLSEADRKEGYAPRSANPSINFCLPLFDPSGNPTKAILHVSGEQKQWGMTDSLFRSELGGSDPWDPKKYCNIWIARLANGIAGYAHLPGVSEKADGIVIDDRFFAKSYSLSNPYCSGKTLSHLIGSYLNLYELWNDYSPCSDDYVEDTPIHNSSNFGLPAYDYQHVSTCYGNPVEMVSNLMDNAIDSVQYLFTMGQVLRMQATLSSAGPRGQLRLTPVTCLGKEQVSSEGTQDRVSTTDGGSLMFNVFPNPTYGRFTIETVSSNATIAHLYVYNGIGMQVYTSDISLSRALAERLTLDASQWSAGLYSILICTDSERISKKLIIEK